MIEWSEQHLAIRDAFRRFVESERNWPGSVARYRVVFDRLVAAT